MPNPLIVWSLVPHEHRFVVTFEAPFFGSVRNQGRWGHELLLLCASATARAAFTFPNPNQSQRP
jgi:hypothetical protein